MSPQTKLALVLGLVLIWWGRGAAQTLPSPSPASDLNIEILNLYPPKYVAPVPDGGARGGYYANGRLRHIPDWTPSADIPLGVSVLKVEFWLEQGAVRLELHAYLGEIAPGSRPPDWEKLQKIKIASRLVHEGETITVEETKRVGVEPFQVRISRAAPWSVGPPEIVNKTQALTVEGTTEQRPAYIVRLHNVSAKTITAIKWYGAVDNREQGGAGQRGARLIPPGKLFQAYQRFASGDESSAGQSNSELPARRQIVIAAVLFEDGSFEGEPDTAAGMAAQWTGESLQLARLMQLLRNVLVNGDGDQTTRLTKLKADITALNVDVDPAVTTNLLIHFPGVSEDMRQRRITLEFKAGLMFAKDNLLREIQRFEFQQKHAPDAKDLSAWLTEMITKYEKVRAPYL
jgi:hypothetical protein